MQTRPKTPAGLIALLLAATTFAIYWPSRHFDLIYFDDPILLTSTPEVQAGLTWAGIKWAFGSVVIANWQPVTNLSFLLVAQLFGVAAGMHHLANAVLHGANAALLFLVVWRLTGATGRSAAVAALFAWHPLRVESVAWIAERKDVLCAFFFLLSLLFYANYARAKINRAPPAAPRKSTFLYLASWLAFLLALLSKPMAVTLPCVLLLLDVWPLGRWAPGRGRLAELKPLLAEKIPFFALMILFCLATYVIQHNYAAMTPWNKLGLAPRIANAISSYVAYPAQLVWPLNLAAIYPYPAGIDLAQTILKAALLATVSLGCILERVRRPWLMVGWFWYVGTALPVIGLVQVGEQAMADRYTYLPLIGPVLALVWVTADFARRWPWGKAALAGLTGAVLAALVCLSERQLHFWRDTIALFEHNLAVTPANPSAWFTLGLGFEHAGDTNRALVCYRTAKLIAPGDLQNHRNLAVLLAKENQLAAAEAEYQSLIAAQPDDCADAVSLAGLLAQAGREDASLELLKETVRLSPDCVEALNNLAWELATTRQAGVRDAPRAVTLAQRACELTGYRQTLLVGTLAAAQAQAGRFDEAIATAQRACALAEENGQTNLLQRNRDLLEHYRQHQRVIQ